MRSWEQAAVLRGRPKPNTICGRSLVDETSKALIVKSLKRLIQWARQLQSGREAHPDLGDGVGVDYPTIQDVLYI